MCKDSQQRIERSFDGVWWGGFINREPATVENDDAEKGGRMMDKHWCMCEVLQGVARDGWSTCSLCGGKDAYGGAKDRPADKRKTIKEDG